MEPFRIDSPTSPSYAQMARFAEQQQDAFGYADEPALECFCAD